MKKPIFVEGAHDYDVEINDNVYRLFYSEGEQWMLNTQGHIILQIKDTGSEYKILSSPPIVRKKIECDMLLELSILLRIIFQDRTIELAEKITI
jgi:hypothetical protein